MYVGTFTRAEIELATVIRKDRVFRKTCAHVRGIISSNGEVVGVAVSLAGNACVIWPEIINTFIFVVCGGLYINSNKTAMLYGVILHI